MEILVLSALFAVLAAVSALAYIALDARNDELEEHLDELCDSIDERFQGQLEIIQKLHNQVDGIETNIEKEGISTLTLSAAEKPSDKIREGLVKFGVKERKLRSAKDMTFNLAKPKKKQARKTR